MTIRRNAATALAALLDALEADLMTSPAEELQAALVETGRAQENAVLELRSLLRHAETEGDHARAPTRLSGERDESDAPRH